MTLSRWVPVLTLGLLIGGAPTVALSDEASEEMSCVAKCYQAEEVCTKACPSEVGVGEQCRTVCAETGDSCRQACPQGGDEPSAEDPVPPSP